MFYNKLLILKKVNNIDNPDLCLDSVRHKQILNNKGLGKLTFVISPEMKGERQML